MDRTETAFLRRLDRWLAAVERRPRAAIAARVLMPLTLVVGVVLTAVSFIYIAAPTFVLVVLIGALFSARDVRMITFVRRSAMAVSVAASAVGIAVLMRRADDDVGGRALDLQFAGSGRRLDRILADLAASDGFEGGINLAHFASDFALIAVYSFAGLALIAITWRPSNSDLFVRWGLSLALGVAGLADVAENLTTAFSERIGTDVAAPIIFTLAVVKWTLLGATVIALVTHWSTRRAAVAEHPVQLFDQPPRVWVGAEQAESLKGTGAKRLAVSDLSGEEKRSDSAFVGICCSGGGIRSAAFCLGALHGLGPERVRNAKHLAAVSGGSYIASAMSALQWRHPERYQDVLPFGEGTSELKRLRAQSRYLFADGSGGRTTIVRAVFATIFNVVLLWLVLFAVLRPIGWLVSSEPLHPELRASGEIVGGVELADDVVIDDITITADAAWPTSCDEGTNGRAYSLVVAAAATGDRLPTPQSSDVRRAVSWVTTGGDPGVIEVCGSVAELVRQPYLTIAAPLTVERQPELELDTDRPFAEVGDEAPAALLSRLEVKHQPQFGHTTSLNGRDEIEIAPWMWAVVLLGLAGAVIATTLGKKLLTAGTGTPTLRLPFTARISLGVALVVLVGAIVLPIALQEVPDLLDTVLIDRFTSSATATGTAAWLALFSAAYAAARSASKRTAEVQGTMRRLGLTGVKVIAYLTSVAMACGMAFGIAQYAALNGPKGRLGGLGSTFLEPTWLFASPDVVRWFVVVVLLLVLRPALDVHSWSLHPVYRDRLSTAFFKGLDGAPTANLGARARQRRNTQQGGQDWPLLTICATANLNDKQSLEDTSAGRWGQSFIFSEDVVGWPENYVGTADYAERVAGRNARLLDLDSIVAVSGAAFSPAMGKFGFGPIGGLMAILNLRLGMWVPNPREVCKAKPATWRGTPGWPYLLREVFGRYRRDLPHLYVTDGGHWENLGLVELLRRGCNEIYVISAAGDGEHRFSTIGEAIALAREVANIDVSVELTPLRPPVGGSDSGDRQFLDASGKEPEVRRFAVKPFAIGSFEYPDTNDDGRGRGVILFVESALTSDVPWDVQAWAEKNPTFPNDSTTDQFFDYGQFEAYRRLGEHQMKSAAGSRDWAAAKLWRANSPIATRP